MFFPVAVLGVVALLSASLVQGQESPPDAAANLAQNANKPLVSGLTVGVCIPGMKCGPFIPIISTSYKGGTTTTTIIIPKITELTETTTITRETVIVKEIPVTTVGRCETKIVVPHEGTRTETVAITIMETSTVLFENITYTTSTKTVMITSVDACVIKTSEASLGPAPNRDTGAKPPLNRDGVAQPAAPAPAPVVSANPPANPASPPANQQPIVAGGGDTVSASGVPKPPIGPEPKQIPKRDRDGG